MTPEQHPSKPQGQSSLLKRIFDIGTGIIVAITIAAIACAARPNWEQGNRMSRENGAQAKLLQDDKYENQKLEAEISELKTDAGKEAAARAAGYLPKNEIPLTLPEKP